MKIWRPLTCLNTIYKLISSLLSSHPKCILASILGSNQKAYVAEQYISKVSRQTFNFFHYANNNNKRGIHLLVDFEKAFDSISFKFILTMLNILGILRPVFTGWINIILGNTPKGSFDGVTVSLSQLKFEIDQAEPSHQLLFCQVSSRAELSGVGLSWLKNCQFYFFCPQLLSEFGSFDAFQAKPNWLI